MLRLLWSVFLTCVWALPVQAQQDFLQPEAAFQLSVSKQADGQLRLHWDISPGYYLYRQQMHVAQDPAGEPLQVNWAGGTWKTDATYGESEVYQGQVTALVHAPQAQALTLGWQGCAEAGLCYPPQTRRVVLADVQAPAPVQADAAAARLNVNLGPLAFQVSHLLLLAGALVAAGVGHLVGRRHKAGIGSSLFDMFWAALLASRLAFVIFWFDLYRQAPWGMLDIRDGGFSPWAGLMAAVGVALWRGWRRPALRQPLLWGLMAGLLTWAALSGTLGALDKATQSGLPTVELLTLEGQPTRLAALANGQPVVVNLWASWCPPCRREMPVLAAAQQQETQVRFVFVNQGEAAKAAQHYLGAVGLHLANLLLDPNTTMGRAIGSTALPTTLFYDASGKLVDTHLGELSAASLASKLNRLRAQPPGKEQQP